MFDFHCTCFMGRGGSCGWRPLRTLPQSPCLLENLRAAQRKLPVCPSPLAGLPPHGSPCRGLGPGSPGLGVSVAAIVEPRGEWLPLLGLQVSHLLSGRLKLGVSVTPVPHMPLVRLEEGSGASCGDKGAPLIRGDAEALSKSGARDRGSCTWSRKGQQDLVPGGLSAEEAGQ